MGIESEIIIVSGLPRSGTSLMMQMLERGGIELVTDQVRIADADNPRGYYEFEKVKKLKQDASWLPEARGKAIKVISQLLYDLPAGESYRILFMERDLDETLTSQERMLERLGRKPAPRDQMRESFRTHLDRLHTWLGQHIYMKVLRVDYNRLIEDALAGTQEVSTFLDGRLEATKMASAIDPELYRNRGA